MAKYPLEDANTRPQWIRYATIEDFNEHILKLIKKKCKENIYFIQRMQKLKQAYRRAYQLGRYMDCSTLWRIVSDRDKYGRYYYRTVFRNGCNDKLCNICSWQKAKNDKMLIARILQKCKYNYSKAFIFMTFSRIRCYDDSLASEIKKLQQAFHQLMQNRHVKAICNGYIKKLEISYNTANHSYLAHYHVLLVVERKDLHRVTKKEWLALWRTVNRDIKLKNLGIDRHVNIGGKKVYALANYIAKPQIKNYKDIPQDIFNALHISLNGKQLLVFGGLCKNIKLGIENKHKPN